MCGGKKEKVGEIRVSMADRMATDVARRCSRTVRIGMLDIAWCALI